MPELPDITLYLDALERFVTGREILHVRLASPFVVRTFDPKIKAIEGHRVTRLHRIGKRIVWELDAEGPLFLVIHLMIAGRFHWKNETGAKIPGRIGLAAFDLPDATLLLTEASTKKRASLHLVRGEAALEEFRRGGLEVLDSSPQAFAAALRAENHTIKRSMTDPTILSGIGNAYSDEILFRAKLSPVKLTSRLSDEEMATLHRATLDVLKEWIERLRKDAGADFPEKVTAFRPEMAVHGRHKLPCPVCASPVQRIVHGDNESNYCATCQTGGKLLADRGLSRLLKDDWPKSLDEMDERRARDAARK